VNRIREILIVQRAPIDEIANGYVNVYLGGEYEIADYRHAQVYASGYPFLEDAWTHLEAGVILEIPTGDDASEHAVLIVVQGYASTAQSLTYSGRWALRRKFANFPRGIADERSRHNKSVTSCALELDQFAFRILHAGWAVHPEPERSLEIAKQHIRRLSTYKVLHFLIEACGQ